MKVDSPCRLICMYDREDVCIGCHRSAEEITNWESYSDLQKLEVWKNIRRRKKEVEK